MMKYIVLTVLLAGAFAWGGESTIVRDASGRIAGSTATSGGRTVYRDASGRTVGSAKK